MLDMQESILVRWYVEDLTTDYPMMAFEIWVETYDSALT